MNNQIIHELDELDEAIRLDIIHELDEAIRLDPENAWIYLFRAITYYEKGEYNRAIADCEKIIKLKPEGAGSYAGVASINGNSATKKGEYDRAIARFNAAIKLDPEGSGSYNDRGVAYRRKGEYDKAMADYDKAIKLDSKNAIYYVNTRK